ncbi:uncharacterized protein MEPE_00833 [Melanopsichium pennsylvanicum]|uniref:Uncharacterized protein n=1 Tax=Melanopsichium pennsylvanicum TaxID=63383 RepID=A0AAJ5C322_9BASI|nr:uncharacterized protein MEPE_00833 [Melanopsichium pennsylvanicum]
MAIAMSTVDDPQNTVAVIPFSLAPAVSSRTATTALSSSSTNSLVTAASNLISVIAQGSTPHMHTTTLVQSASVPEVDQDDQGSSSFTYTAPAADTTNTSQTRWYASTPYHISNRYYEADISIKATKDALLPTSSDDGALSQQYPAYLVVVDASRSLEYHHRLAAALESKVASGFDADISIVAGVSLLTSSSARLVTNLDDQPSHMSSGLEGETKAKVSDLVALYADVGWEFIAIDETDEDDSDGRLSLGSSERDDYSHDERDDDMDGIERIREALMNRMWDGLVRKDEGRSLMRSPVEDSQEVKDVASTMFHRGFSDTIDTSDDKDDLEGGVSSNTNQVINGNSDKVDLPELNLNHHVQSTSLDEQLAKLFLSSTNGSNAVDDFDALEAFLESQDPSWPKTSQSSCSSENTHASIAFDDDFLPFQSAPNPAPPTTTATTTTISLLSDVGTEEGEVKRDELPTKAEVEQMQNELFGSNTAARLEAGPLGLRGNLESKDFASQLQQLQWHAERVRAIQDPETRSKEAALVALAFSVQWSNDFNDNSHDDGEDAEGTIPL